MKKINLTYIRLPDKTSYMTWQKTYSILLGNEIKVSFSSEKKAKKFIADTNRFLNLQLQELNQVYIQLFAEYRRLWFIIDFEENIEDSFHDINKYFKKLTKHGHSENSNIYVFLDFIRISNEIKTVTEKLITFLKDTNNYSGANILSSLPLRVDNILDAVNNYGKDQGQV